jgi:hypothetical protein
MSSRASSLPRWTVWAGKLSIGMKSAAYRARSRSLATTDPVRGISIYFCRIAKSRAIRKSPDQPGLPWEGACSRRLIDRPHNPFGCNNVFARKLPPTMDRVGCRLFLRHWLGDASGGRNKSGCRNPCGRRRRSRRQRSGGPDKPVCDCPPHRACQHFTHRSTTRSQSVSNWRRSRVSNPSVA